MHTFNQDDATGLRYSVGRMVRERVGDMEADAFVPMVTVCGATQEKALLNAMAVVNYLNGGTGYKTLYPEVEQAR